MIKTKTIHSARSLTHFLHVYIVSPPRVHSTCIDPWRYKVSFIKLPWGLLVHCRWPTYLEQFENNHHRQSAIRRITVHTINSRGVKIVAERWLRNKIYEGCVYCVSVFMTSKPVHIFPIRPSHPTCPAGIEFVAFSRASLAPTAFRDDWPCPSEPVGSQSRPFYFRPHKFVPQICSPESVWWLLKGAVLFRNGNSFEL